MNDLEALLQYLKNRYDPVCMILYGSWSRGTNKPTSDFDILVVSRKDITVHDIDTVCGVQLDAFVYPEKHISELTDYDEIVQIHDGIVVHDTDGYGSALLERVRYYIDHVPEKSAEELREDFSWCAKTLRRACAGGASGDYRYHFLVLESLDIYCAVTHSAFLGPNTILDRMAERDPESYALYCAAMHTVDTERLTGWIVHLLKLGGYTLESFGTNI